MAYQFVNQVNQLLQTRSWRKMAKEIGLSQSTLSAYLKGEYSGDVAKIEERIKSYLERQAERGDRWRDLIVQTSTMREIKKSLGLIHAMRKMGVIYGPAGLGKTESARRYVDDTPGVHLVTAAPDCKSVAGIIFILHQALFKEDFKVNPRVARAAIVNRLAGSDKMIIVDDADELTNEAIEELRAIHDASEVPIVMIGTEMLLERLIHPRSRRILARVSSRIPVRRLFKLEPSYQDLKLVCDAYGVQDKEVIKRLADKGKRGGLRLAVHQIKIAKLLAGNEAVNLKHLIDAEIISGDDGVEE